MDLGLFELTIIGLAIFLSSIVQGAVGFAVALIAVPLLLQAGLDLSQSIFVVLICGFVQNGLGLRQTWSETPIRQLTGWAVFRSLLVPVGFVLMRYIENYSKSELRQLFGMILITVICLQLVFRVKPRPSVHWTWTTLAMTISGVSQGMIGTPGPPIAFWVMAHDWESKRSRGTMYFLFLPGSLLQMVLLLIVFDWQTIRESSLIGICGIPLSFAGASIGLWVGNRFDRKRIRLAIITTLVLLSLALILAP